MKTAISRPLIFALVVISSMQSFSRELMYDQDAGFGDQRAGISVVPSLEEREARQRDMDARIKAAGERKAAIRAEGARKNSLALEAYRCGLDGSTKSPEESSSICISEEDVAESKRVLSPDYTAQLRKEYFKKSLTAWVMELGKVYSSKALQTFYFVEKKTMRSVKLLEIFDDSRFVAFVRAAKVCTELDADGSFAVKGSEGCKTVRESILMGELKVTSALTGLSISEIAGRMEQSPLVESRLTQYLSDAEEAALAAQNQDTAALKIATAYLMHSMPKINNLLRK